MWLSQPMMFLNVANPAKLFPLATASPPHWLRDHLAQHVEVLGMSYENKEDKDKGWLTAFMDVINATWPHRDHVLVNQVMLGEGNRLKRQQYIAAVAGLGTHFRFLTSERKGVLTISPSI